MIKKYKPYRENSQVYFTVINNRYDINNGKRKMAKIDLEKYGVRKGENGYESGGNAFIKAADIGKIGDSAEITITDVKEVSFKDGDKVVIDITVPSLKDTDEGEERSLTLNKTNLKRLLDFYGEDFDKWKGKTPVIHIDKVEYKGKPTPGMVIYEA